MSEATWKRYVRRLLPRGVRPHRILGGPLRGLRIMTSWYDYPGAILGRTERPLLQWFAAQARPGETWLDIGAHYGYTALALSRAVGPRGRVFAFEPNPATFGHLATTGTLNAGGLGGLGGLGQLQPFPFGLGAPDSIEMRRLGMERGMADSTIAADGTTPPLIVARLDWLWPRICEGNPAIHGVKIDVEGMELEVLRGMTALLREFTPKLVVELHAGVSREDVLECVGAAGYDRHALAIEPGAAGSDLLDGHSYYFSAIA